MVATYLGQIVDHQVLIIPCQNLIQFIKNIKIESAPDKMPLVIQALIFDTTPKYLNKNDFSKTAFLVTEHDKKFLKSLKPELTNKTMEVPSLTQIGTLYSGNKINGNWLNIQDLHWLYKYIQTQNTNSNTKIYIHELMEGSKIVLPKNKIICRNEELDKRCKTLTAEQQNKEYQTMTKNVSNPKQKFEDDTIYCQLRMMNRHLIAVFQYVVSIITGFSFGFYGIEMLTTPLDLGFRLLLGVICGLTVALAELYFLAKALNMDLENDTSIYKQKRCKVS